MVYSSLAEHTVATVSERPHNSVCLYVCMSVCMYWCLLHSIIETVIKLNDVSHEQVEGDPRTRLLPKFHI